MRLLRVLAAVAGWTLLAGASLWAGLALWIDGPAAQWLRILLVAGYALAVLAVVVTLRPPRRAPAVVLLFLFVVLWWTSIPASNDRDWLPDVARPPRAELDGDRLTIHNLRDFEYRSETDFTEHWETRTFDLSRLRGMDLFFSFWGPTAIAHTITSWDFDDDRHLAISIETRKEKGEEYSALRGFFRQYELIFVVADERDVVRLRTNFRGEDVYVYRLDVSPADARVLLLRYLEEINQLRERPQWYNALTENCTTAIQRLAWSGARRSWWSWKLLVNGYFDELGYDIGAIDRSLPFAVLKAKSHINERAKAADADPRFSVRIRDELPRMSLDRSTAGGTQ